jgi:hypothetical protein
MTPQTTPQSDNHELQRISYIVGIITGAILILGTVIAWFSGLAFASDVSDLAEKHDKDVQSIQIIIYQKDIDAITLKPDKSQYDKDLLNLYKSRVESIKKTDG